MVDAGRPAFRLRRHVLPAQGLARAAQAGPAEDPGADRRTRRQADPALAARYADEFNIPFGSVEDCARQFGRVREAADAYGRKAGDIVYSNALVACVGKDDAAVERRAAAIGRDADELKANGLAGSPAQVVDKIGRYAELGATRFYLQILDLDDIEHLELISSEVQSQLN